MSDGLQQILRRLSAIERRLDRLTANDQAEIEPWTAWTPELYGSTTAGTITYTTQDGYYCVIDATVFVYGLINVNTIPVAPTGSLLIRTLPYTSVDVVAFSMSTRANLSTNYTNLECRTEAGSNSLQLLQSGDDLRQVYPAANLNTNFSISFAGFYRIA